MAGIDLNRTSAGAADLLPREISTEIWAKATEESAVMRLSRQITLPGSGITIPIITGDASAEWVNETDEKPVSKATVGSKNLTPYKLAVIELFSNEFRRDAAGLYNALVQRLPMALGRKFDETIFHGTAPGSGFDVLSGAAAVVVDGTDTLGDLTAALTTVGAAGGNLSGWVLSPQAEGTIIQAKDGSGNYAFLRDARTDGAVGSLFGRPVMQTSAVYADGGAGADTIGFAGDFSSAIYGTVEGIQVAISDQATVNDGTQQVNLWQRNMFAVRAEVEVGFVVKDGAHFVRLTGAAA